MGEGCKAVLCYCHECDRERVCVELGLSCLGPAEGNCTAVMVCGECLEYALNVAKEYEL